MSQMRIVLSTLAATTVRPSGLNVTALMTRVNPASGSESRCGRRGSVMSHSCTAWSSAAVAMVRPSGLNATMLAYFAVLGSVLSSIGVVMSGRVARGDFALGLPQNGA
jgi:hypothetical protein